MGLEPELLLILYETDIETLTRSEMSNNYDFFALKPEFTRVKTLFTLH